MNHLKKILFVFFISLGFSGIAQEVEPLTKVPKKKEFKSSEPNFVASVNWIENTAFDEDAEMHEQQYALIVGWMSDSPDVTITLNGYVLDYIRVNKDLLAFFMGAWGKYSIENGYSNDLFQCNLAAVRSMINIYKTGKMKTDSKMQELVDLDAGGKLEDWVKIQIDQK